MRRTALLLSLVGLGCAPDAPARRDVASLSAAELTELTDAIVALKDSPPLWDYESVCAGNTPSVPLADGAETYTLNAYDAFVELHLVGAALAAWKMTTVDPDSTAPDSRLHMSATFLPWHRQFLLRFEEALQTVSGNPDLMLPYWDWSDPTGAGWTQEGTLAIFSPDAFGGVGSSGATPEAVSDGAFVPGVFDVHVQSPDFTAFAAGPDLSGQSLQERQDAIVPLLVTATCATLPVTRLNLSLPPPPTAAAIDALVDGELAYDATPFNMMSDPGQSLRQSLEGFPVYPAAGCAAATAAWDAEAWDACWNQDQVTAVDMFLFFFGGTMHAAAHGAVGGTMGSYSSPNDPVFFLHHAQVDRLWAQWQEASGSTAADYPAEFADEALFGFEGVLAEDVWSLEDVGYRYE